MTRGQRRRNRIKVSTPTPQYIAIPNQVRSCTTCDATIAVGTRCPSGHPTGRQRPTRSTR